MTKAEFAPWLKRLEREGSLETVLPTPLESLATMHRQATNCPIRRSSRFVVLRQV